MLAFAPCYSQAAAAGADARGAPPPVRMVRSRGRGLSAGRGYGQARQARFSGVRDAPAGLGATFVSVGACT